MKLGIIGATGWLGSATGARLLDSGTVSATELTLLNRSGPRGRYHGRDVHWAADTAELVLRSDVILLSVRPADWPALALHAPDRLLISFLAGTGIDALSVSGARVVRAMPNAAAELGASYSPWVAGPGVTDADRGTLRTILSTIGQEDELADEAALDLMTAAPGSGAAYPALLALAAQDWMARNGIPPDIAARAARAMVCGGARLIEESDPAALVAAYRDYQGTTAAGITAAETAGLAEVIGAALDAATRRARDMR